MDQVKDQDIGVSEDILITRVQNFENNTYRMGADYELVSLSSECAKHLSRVVLNNYNLLFGLSPTPFVFPVLIHYIHQLCLLYFFICKIRNISNSKCKCECTCKCEPLCKGNFICLCFCTNGKPEGTECCICICKKQDENCNCKCICICKCDKTGHQCCCAEGQKHECKDCLVKVDIQYLLCDTSKILNNLRFIRCYISRIENKCCLCSCCEVKTCERSCCSECARGSSAGCCCCSCCVGGSTNQGSCESYCCCKDGTINYSSIITRIDWIVLLLKEVGKKILELTKMNKTLAFYSNKITTEACKSCNCKDKIKALTENIEKAGQYYSSFASVIGDIKSLVDYKTFSPQANEIIEKLKFSVKPLLNQLGEINGQILGNVYYTGISNNLLLVVYSHFGIFQCFLAMYILLQSSSMSYSIFNVFKTVNDCECAKCFEKNNKNIEKFSIKTFDENISTSTDLAKLIAQKNENHLCLCLVIKYVLYPSLIKSLYLLRYIYFDVLSKQTKEFVGDSCTSNQVNEVTKLIYLTVIILDKITLWMKVKYYYAWIGYVKGVYIKCFCLYSDDPYYPYLISIILFVSSLVDNIWTMDTQTIRMAIDNISSLLSEYQSLHVYTNYGSGKSNNLEVKIPVLYNSAMIKGFGDKNGLNAISYSGLSLKYKIFSFNNMSGHITSLMLINKLNITKDRLSRFYQIFSRLSFEINMKWTYTQIKINRSIYMYVSNLYMAILKEMCSNTKCQDAQKCKCPKVKIYVLSILMIFIYGKLKSKIDITEDLLYIMDLLKKNKFDEYMKVMKNIADNYINHNNMTTEYIKSCLKMTKNNLLTSSTNDSGINLNITNPETVRNWGYDTQYEHDVTFSETTLPTI